MEKQRIANLKDVIKSMCEDDRIDDAINYVKNIFGVDKVQNYLKSNQFITDFNLMMSLQDDLKDEAQGLDEFNHDVGDIEPLSVKIDDVQTIAQAPYYDVNAGNLDAEPINTLDLWDMVDTFLK